MVVLDLRTNNRNTPFPKAAASQTNGSTGAAAGSTEVWASAGVELASQIVAAIQRHILTAETFSDLVEKLDAVKPRLQADASREELTVAGIDIGSVLEAFQHRVREANLETAVDFQKILSLVNESFTCIQAGDAKADERLKYFEKGLSEAAKMDSLASLRRHLSGMLEFTRQESRADLLEKDTKLKSMTEQMRQVQSVQARLRVSLPGRLEALEFLKGIIANGQPGGSVSLFAIDSLKALLARHGEAVATSILDELGRKQVQPLAPEGKLFCWSNSALALVAPLHEDGGSTLGAVPGTFEHRAFTGTRMAVFKVNVRSISLTLPRSIEEITASLEAFLKENVS